MLTGVWRECFLAAWESFRAGSIPVGAALVDERDMPDVLRLARRLAGAPATRLRTMTLDQAAAEILGIASS